MFKDESKKKGVGSSGSDNMIDINGTSPIFLNRSQLIPISPDWITAFAAIAALVVAIIIALKQISIQKEQTEIARRQLIITEYQEQERRKGKLQAEFIAKTYTKNEGIFSGEPFLQIENRGPADARDVTISVKGDAQLIDSIIDLPKEISLIAAGSSFEYHIILTDGALPDFTLYISWSDDSREIHHKEIPLRA